MQSLAAAFPDITRRGEPLAPYTYLKIGGPAEFFVEPRTADELAAVLRFCKKNKVPLRMLGGGHNLLVRDDPVAGAVMRLGGPAFGWIEGAGGPSGRPAAANSSTSSPTPSGPASRGSKP